MLVALRCQSGGDLQLLRIVLVRLRQAVGNEGVWTLEGGGKRHCVWICVVCVEA